MSVKTFHRILHARGLVLIAAAFACVSFATQPCDAATFTVDRTDDAPAATACTAAANDCSLRGAIVAANALAAASTIDVPAGTYVLTSASTCNFRRKGSPAVVTTASVVPLCLSGQVALHGAGAATTVIDGNGVNRTLIVSFGAVAEVRGVTITNGIGDDSLTILPVGGGGGVNNHGSLNLVETLVTNNTLPGPPAGLPAPASTTSTRSRSCAAR